MLLLLLLLLLLLFWSASDPFLEWSPLGFFRGGCFEDEKQRISFNAVELKNLRDSCEEATAVTALIRYPATNGVIASVPLSF